ncbi:hypothetical protein BDV12DRAFT_190750 [Aspergillus spectabilis]
MPNQIRDIATIDTESFPYIFENNVTVKLKSNTGLVDSMSIDRKMANPPPFLAHSFEDVNPKHKSEHSAFEVPDPRFWTADGYAVVRADEVGIGQSPGVCDTMSRSTTDAFVDVIEWAADQPWSNGKIGLLGISYFAGTQWRVAARRPRGLTCYRCRHGGILTARFLKFWHDRQVKSNQYGLPGREKNQRGPDTIEGDLTQEELDQDRHDQDVENALHFFRDEEYYASRDYNLEDIEVPLLSVGNLGNIVVHLRGNVEGYINAGSEFKFLRLGTKGKQPKVTLALRKSGVPHDSLAAMSGQAFPRRAENEWPLARTRYTKYFLSPDLTFAPQNPSVSVHKRLSYPALTVPEDNSFIRFTTSPFTEETEMTGHIVARVNVSVTPKLGGGVPKDIDIFLTLRHWDADGNEVFYTGSIGDPVPISKGWQRVSLRKINYDHPRHREWRLHRDYFSTDVQPVSPGEVYPVDVEVWPTQVIFQKGERLSFEISGGDTQGAGIFSHESPERSEERFGGMNHIHFGPNQLNYVVLPIIPAAR